MESILMWISKHFLVGTGLVIIACTGFDLLFRWIAYKRVDSIAVALSFFSCIFCLVRFITLNSLDRSPGILDSVEVNWLIRVTISVVLYFIISMAHGGLRLSLYTQYSEKVQNASFWTNSGALANDPDLNSRLRHSALKVLNHSIYLTFSTFSKNVWLLQIRPGKRDIRSSAALLLTGITKTEFDNSDFEIGKKMQVLCVFAFFIAGIFAVLVATIKLGTYFY